MEETLNSILYGKLEVEIPPNLTLKQQLEVLRAIVANQTSLQRVKVPNDLHPWVNMLFTQMKNNNNGEV